MRRAILTTVALAGAFALLAIWCFRAYVIDAEAAGEAGSDIIEENLPAKSDDLRRLVLRTYTKLDGHDVPELCSTGWASENGLVSIDGDALPMKTILWIRGMRGILIENRLVTNKDIQEIVKLQSLQCVRLHKCRFEDSIDWSLLSSTSWEYVELSGVSITEYQLDLLLNALPSGVSCIEFNDSPLGDSLVRELQRFTNLEYVGISQNTTMTDEGFARLCEIKSLRFVEVAQFSTRISRAAKAKARKKKATIQIDEV